LSISTTSNKSTINRNNNPNNILINLNSVCFNIVIMIRIPSISNLCWGYTNYIRIFYSNYSKSISRANIRPNTNISSTMKLNIYIILLRIISPYTLFLK